MKKLLRFLVPMVLVIIILCSIVWYGFVYDRGLTQELLVRGARYCADAGFYRTSSLFYDLAYRQSGQDENVAIELAEQYKAGGNYTKAEYTLSRAIADGGTVELYMALCKTYVEQDKLMDAVAMLDSIGDDFVKNQINKMRPVIRNVTPSPGFYSQYVSVAMEATEGVIYYSATPEYPSINTEPYSQPLSLSNGESTISAVAVAENGLVSPLMLLGYTIGGVIEEVTMEDTAIEAAVRAQLGLSDDVPILSSDLWTITEFTVPAAAKSLADLSRMNYLQRLTAADVTIDSLQSLSGLSMLQSVDLSGSRFPAADLSVLAALPDLKILKLTNCGLSTISGLEGAPSLTQLYLNSNTLRNLSPLSGIVTLQELYLQNNAIVDLSALSGLTELRTLNASHNSVAALGNTSGLTKLTGLDLGTNKLTSVAGIDRLTNLTTLNLSSNQLSDVTALAGCINLTDLNISRNYIADIAGLKSLSKVQNLDFSYNEVTSLPAWSRDCALYSIDGSSNQLTSLSSLEGMEHLAYVYMDYNLLTSVAPLASCSHLVQVNVYGNEIPNVSALTAQSIIVNYDPTV